MEFANGLTPRVKVGCDIGGFWQKRKCYFSIFHSSRLSQINLLRLRMCVAYATVSLAASSLCLFPVLLRNKLQVQSHGTRSRLLYSTHGRKLRFRLRGGGTQVPVSLAASSLCLFPVLQVQSHGTRSRLLPEFIYRS